MSDAPKAETADRSGSDAPTCSAWREAPETVKEWRDAENMRPDPRAKRMVHHAVKMEIERNKALAWAKRFRDLLEPIAWLEGMESPNDAEKAIMEFDQQNA